MSLRSSLALAFLLSMTVAAETFAQTPASTSTLRVTKAQSVIWRVGFSAPATVVSAGTELDAVARRGNWYEVVVPASGTTTAGMHGLIAVNQVELIRGPVPPNLALRAASASSPSSPSVSGQAREPGRPTGVGQDHAGVRGFGEVGYGRLLAHQTFRAVFNQSGIPWWGAGVEYRLGTGGFVQGAFRRFHGTGERVFVFDGEVTRTGISDTVTITPVDFTIGYRAARHRHATYVGAGFGRYLYRETFAFADPSDTVKLTLTSYHAMAGYEQRLTSWIAAAFEVQYTHVPDALTGNLADALKEHNLGGIEARVRIAVGR